MLSNEIVEMLYCELTMNEEDMTSVTDEVIGHKTATSIGIVWNNTDWGEDDNISDKEYQEVVKLHQHKRRELITKLLGEQDGS